VSRFGVVKAATHSVTGQRVAIKIMKKGTFDDEEIRIQKMLDHKHLVKIFDVIEIDDHVCIVMECVTGGDLFDYLVKHVRLEESEALRLFRQLMEGVNHCHTSGVVHRDLKAENILLDGNNNIKIADFGFAAEMTPGELLTKSCGSPNYAAPELLYKGCQYHGPEIDVWSCGVILFALLTITLPFDADSIPMLFKLIKRGQFRLPGYVSDDAKDLVQRMLTVDAEKRISIAEIRKHRWFTSGSHEEKAEEIEEKTIVAPMEEKAEELQEMEASKNVPVTVPSKIPDEKVEELPKMERSVSVPVVDASKILNEKLKTVNNALRLVASAQFTRALFKKCEMQVSTSCGSFGRLDASPMVVC